MSIWAKYRASWLALVLTLVAGLLVVAPVQARPKPPQVTHAMKQGLKQVGRKAHRQLARAAKKPKAHAAFALGDGYIDTWERCTWGSKVEYPDGSQTGRWLAINGPEPRIWARGPGYAQTIAMRWGVAHKHEGVNDAWENWGPWRYTFVTTSGTYFHGATIGRDSYYWWDQRGQWIYGQNGLYWLMENPAFANTASQGAIQVAWWNQNTSRYTTQTAFIPNLDGSQTCFLQADSF